MKTVTITQYPEGLGTLTFKNVTTVTSVEHGAGYSFLSIQGVEDGVPFETQVLLNYILQIDIEGV